MTVGFGLMPSGRNIASEIAQLRLRVREDLATGSYVQIIELADGNTDVRVEHVFPKPPFRVDRGWWRATSTPMRLLSDLFESPNAVALLNRISTGKDRVRVLHAVRAHSGRQPAPSDMYASVGFHIDERNSVPVVLRAVALRVGDARPVSEMLAAVLIDHLVSIDAATWTALSDEQRQQAAGSEPRPCVVADDKDVIIADSRLLTEWGMRDKGAVPHMSTTGRTLRYE